MESTHTLRAVSTRHDMILNIMERLRLLVTMHPRMRTLPGWAVFFVLLGMVVLMVGLAAMRQYRSGGSDGEAPHTAIIGKPVDTQRSAPVLSHSGSRQSSLLATGAHETPSGRETPAVRVDSSRPGILLFSQPSYSIRENKRYAMIKVNRKGGSQGAVFADFEISNEYDTAIQGIDYEVVNGMLRWADGDAKPKFLKVRVMDDADAEADECITLTLMYRMGSRKHRYQALVTIVDDDAQ